MNVNARTHSAGFQLFTVEAEGGEFELSAFGAQLLSWTKDGVPIVFANAGRAIIDGHTAYRGGAPICFPYFGKGSLLPGAPTVTPQHGKARTTVWEAEVRDNAIVFRTEQPAPEGFGPTTLACELAYIFNAGLSIEARITNIGGTASPFQLAVHTYWACEDPDAVTVEGLGTRFLNNLIGLQPDDDPSPEAPHLPPVDRVYVDSAAHLVLTAQRYRLDITTIDGSSAVLWNPGPDHTIADLGAPDFVCLENGVITPPVTLEPGQTHVFTLDYRAEAVSEDGEAV